jgi:hypothetical protein
MTYLPSRFATLRGAWRAGNWARYLVPPVVVPALVIVLVFFALMHL